MTEKQKDQMENENIEPIFEETEEVTENQNGETEVNEETKAENTASGKGEAKDAKIAELEKKLQEADAKYLRLYADFDNYRRRVKLDTEAAQKYRAQSLVTNLLPALDNFERALKATPETEENNALLQGMNMVLNNILSALKEEGVEPIEAVGKEFDPHVHQAIMQDSNDEFESNYVVEEFQKGYKLKDRVIRPSMVKVNQ